MQKGRSTQEYDNENTGRASTIASRSFFITRGEPKSNRTSMYNSSRASLSQSISPGIFKEMSSAGVTDFKGNREKEKRELQGLNERLANYIDKVHFLEATIKKLEAENEALRNRKTEDLKPIRDAYENELAQARKVIDQLSSTKGVSEAKLAGLQDEIDSLRDLIRTLESQAKDYRKKIETQNHAYGELEGEVSTLRLRVGALEDENAKLREINDKLQEQIRRLRSDLDAETAAHIEADCLAQTKTEEAEFYKDLLDQLELMKPEPIQIKGMNYDDFWKSEMAKSIRAITAAYEDKLDIMQQDCESKYASQINAMRNGNVKDSMQLNHAQEEVKRLRGQLSDSKALMAELQARCAALESEKSALNNRIRELENDLEETKIRLNQEKKQLADELESCLNELRALMDIKLSMELEISCYKKLLEGEESRVGMRSLIEQSLNTQGRGASSLAEVINQSSSLQESTGSLTVQRSCKGNVGFNGMDNNGKNIVLENTTRAKSQNLKGWKVEKFVGNQVKFSINLKDYVLKPLESYTIWATSGKSSGALNNEQIENHHNFGVGTCIWKLVDDNGVEKATLRASFSG